MTEKLIRVLLRLAPEAFRRERGEELLQTYRSRAGERRTPSAALLFHLREVAGVCSLVLRLRRRGASRTRRNRPARVVWLESAGRDLRFGARSLLRAPAFALTALVVLSVGIGANAAVFSAANAFFFRPLPFQEPDGLVLIYETNPEFGWTDTEAAPANVLDWREQVAAFADVAAYSEFVSRATWLREGEAELVGVATVTGNFFEVLGAPPAAGRTFTWEETWSGDDDVVVLSHAFWMSGFGGDPEVVGTMMEFPGGPSRIVGVAPPGFAFPDSRAQLWTPFGWNRADREAVWFRRAHWVRPVARLAAGVSPEDAAAQLQVVVRRLQSEYPETNEVMGAGLAPLRSFLVKDVRKPLLVLFGAVGLLLLLACINVANLTLVRAADRTREVALRLALGANRTQVLRPLLAETSILAAAGGVVGLLLGWLGVRAAATLAPLGIDGATELALDGRVVLFTAAISGASALLFGLAPVLRGNGMSPNEALKEGGRRATHGRAGNRLASLLVPAEIALALLLVAGAGLMVRSFLHLRSVDPGFRTQGTVAFQLTVPESRYPSRDQVLAFHDLLLERVEALPGVERAGIVGQLPLAGTSWSSQFQAQGWPPERVGFEILHRRADRGYFEALGIPLVRGRLFGPDDEADGPRVVVINETFAREHFPGEDPIGLRIAFDRAADSTSVWHEIVGIVGDQSQVSPGLPPRAEVFENRRQDWGRSDWIVVRTRTDPSSLAPAVRDVLREMDPLVPLASVRPLAEVWRSSMAREEFLLSLLTAFGIAALLLAGVGVYGITAQAARRRTAELGIRMALGAQVGDVLSLMLRQGAILVGVGLAAGYGATLLATRAMDSLLVGVAPTDPATLAAVGGLLAAVALLACYLPARRATRVDPVRSLRAE